MPFCKVNGINIHYRATGKWKPLLFLHGGGAKASTYKENLDLLAKTYHVIAPDIPCFGESSVPGDVWGFEDFANLFSDFIDDLWLQDIVVMGHSFGGGIALHLAARCKKISHLVLIDSAGIAPKYPSRKLPFFLLIKTFRNIFLYRQTSINFIIWRDFFANFRHFFSWGKILATIHKTLFSTATVLDKITQPTAIRWGDSDEVFPVLLAQSLQDNISGSTLTYVQGNHDWCLFMPETFMMLVDEL